MILFWWSPTILVQRCDVYDISLKSNNVQFTFHCHRPNFKLWSVSSETDLKRNWQSSFITCSVIWWWSLCNCYDINRRYKNWFESFYLDEDDDKSDFVVTFDSCDKAGELMRHKTLSMFCQQLSACFVWGLWQSNWWFHDVYTWSYKTDSSVGLIYISVKIHSASLN